jgi:hypothetical protein
MPIDVLATDRIPRSQTGRAVLKALYGVLAGERSQAQPARLLGLTPRRIDSGGADRL